MDTTTTARPARTSARGPSLRGEARRFLRHRSPWLLAGYVVAALAARTAFGSPGRDDLAVVVALVAAQPFVEWLIHVGVLHFRPRVLFGRRFDPAIARSHRRHHENPRDERFVFIDLRALVVIGPVTAAVVAVTVPSRELAATGLATAAALTLAYEWTHFLIHTDYRPRHWLYRRIHRAHRLHHFKNERYWFGVMSTLGDHVLRTAPRPDAVPASPTARTLGFPAAGG